MTELIVEWFYTWNKNGIRINFDIQTTKNHFNAAEKILDQIRLVIKVRVIKKNQQIRWLI